MSELACPDRLGETVAIVTGSTCGIGAGVAKRLAAEGATVVVSGRTETEGKSVVETIRDDGGRATFVSADMRQPEDIKRLIATPRQRHLKTGSSCLKPIFEPIGSLSSMLLSTCQKVEPSSTFPQIMHF